MGICFLFCLNVDFLEKNMWMGIFFREKPRKTYDFNQRKFGRYFRVTKS